MSPHADDCGYEVKLGIVRLYRRGRCGVRDFPLRPMRASHILVATNANRGGATQASCLNPEPGFSSHIRFPMLTTGEKQDDGVK